MKKHWNLFKRLKEQTTEGNATNQSKAWIKKLKRTTKWEALTKVVTEMKMQAANKTTLLTQLIKFLMIGQSSGPYAYAPELVNLSHEAAAVSHGVVSDTPKNHYDLGTIRH